MFVGYLLFPYSEHRNTGSGRAVEVDVPLGAGPSTVAHLLADRGLVDNPMFFEVWLRMEGYPSRLHAGKHLLADDMSTRELAEILCRPGGGPAVWVTLPEGSTMFDAARILEENGVTDYMNFLAVCRSRTLLKEMDIPGGSAEGFLFPDTYQFVPGTPPQAILQRLVRTFHGRFAPLEGKHQEQVQRLKAEYGNAERAVVTMASLIEKEASEPRERGLVAQVFFNRLRDPSFPSRLIQSDPTVAYGCLVDEQKLPPSCRNWNGKLTRLQLEDFLNPYNTYRRPGLPPGPICSPGAASLEAALNPTPGSYYYFVARNDGTHVFSKTLPEHNRAVAQWQRGAEDQR